MHAMNTVCDKLENFANIRMDTTEQHVDASDSRVKKMLKAYEEFQSGSQRMILFQRLTKLFLLRMVSLATIKLIVIKLIKLDLLLWQK